MKTRHPSLVRRVPSAPAPAARPGRKLKSQGLTPFRWALINEETLSENTSVGGEPKRRMLAMRPLPILIGLGIVLFAGAWLWLSSTRSARPAGSRAPSRIMEERVPSHGEMVRGRTEAPDATGTKESHPGKEPAGEPLRRLGAPEQMGAGGALAKAGGNEETARRPAEGEGTREDRRGDAGIATGYFFYLGRYIPRPYRVTVEGYRVLVNGEFPVLTMVEPPKPLPIPVEDPGEFAWTPEKLKMPLERAGLERHAERKLVYWAFRHGPIRAWAMVIEYIKAQPAVKEVRVLDEGYVYVLGASGRGFGFGASPAGLKGFEESLRTRYASSDAEAQRMHEKAIAGRKQQLENLRAQYETLFHEGGLLFLVASGGGKEVHLGGQRARAFLAEIRAVLVSGKGGREKREALRKWLADPDLVEQLMANQKAPWPSLRPE